MYKEIACEAATLLSRFSEANRIALFGSVYRGTDHPGSDVDIAFVCDSYFRNFPLDDEGIPSGLLFRLQEELNPLREKHGRKIHLCFYWEREFDEGVSLGRDVLKDNCEILYDPQEALNSTP
jgi:predicted nucleotidyltransferase